MLNCTSSSASSSCSSPPLPPPPPSITHLAAPEGYGVGNALSEFATPYFPFVTVGLLTEAFQWSLFLFLGAASRAPFTHAGRTLVLANLFFVVLWISVCKLRGDGGGGCGPRASRLRAACEW